MIEQSAVQGGASANRTQHDHVKIQESKEDTRL